jgi:hypothetical protein
MDESGAFSCRYDSTVALHTHLGMDNRPVGCRLFNDDILVLMLDEVERLSQVVRILEEAVVAYWVLSQHCPEDST